MRAVATLAEKVGSESVTQVDVDTFVDSSLFNWLPSTGNFTI